MGFAHSGFVRFMASGMGRVARIIAGFVLIGLGLGVLGGTTGIVVSIVGVVPIVAGALDVCLISALFGGPLSGSAIRRLSPA